MLKLAVSAFKMAKKAYKLYKKAEKVGDKFTPDILKEAGLDEIADLADNLYTIFSDPNVVSKVASAAELITGVNLNKNTPNVDANDVKNLADNTTTILEEVIVKGNDWRKNMKKGKTFENNFYDYLKDKYQIVQKNVTVKAFDEKIGKWRRAVLDFVVEESDGTMRFIETKLKSTTNLTSNQSFCL